MLFYICILDNWCHIPGRACAVAQSCLTLCNPMDHSPPGSSLHGILQTRILEWFARPSSRGSFWLRDQTGSPALQANSLPLSHQGSPIYILLCIKSIEGNGNPIQCSCLENPRDGGAWWAAISGVAQIWTQLKRLSSSSSREVRGCGDKRERVKKQ